MSEADSSKNDICQIWSGIHLVLEGMTNGRVISQCLCVANGFAADRNNVQIQIMDKKVGHTVVWM